jgi:hypothetical protein
MLEQRIEELIVAVKILTEAMKSHSASVNATSNPYTYPDPTAHHAPEQVAAGTKAPNEKQKSEDTTNTSQTSSPELPAAAYEDVKRATNAVSKISREKAIAGLARFGVQSATKLAETQWAEYVAYMGKVAAGEIDPEASHV